MLIAITVAVIAVIGYVAYQYSDSRIPEDVMMEEEGAMMEDESMMTEDDGEMMIEEDSMMEKDEMMEEESMMKLEFLGQVLAGKESPLLDFDKSDYDKAVASDKLIVLYFYANWCPICREEFPKMQSAFNQISGDGVVGFRVNYNDSDTDNNEKELAREFGIAYQHTKVFLKNGQRILKAPESWNSAEMYLSKITEHK